MTNMIDNTLLQSHMNALANNADAQAKINSNEATKSYYQALLQNDQKRGEELAMQILQTYGLSKEEAMQQAYNGLSQMRAMAMGGR